jgi:hypothetical protein
VQKVKADNKDWVCVSVGGKNKLFSIKAIWAYKNKSNHSSQELILNRSIFRFCVASKSKNVMNVVK